MPSLVGPEILANKLDIFDVLLEDLNLDTFGILAIFHPLQSVFDRSKGNVGSLNKYNPNILYN